MILSAAGKRFWQDKCGDVGCTLRLCDMILYFFSVRRSKCCHLVGGWGEEIFFFMVISRGGSG